jgi:adenine-specific DNA-methyltransferase
MSRELLGKVISAGVKDNLDSFFLNVSNAYREIEDDLSVYDDDQFTNFQPLGEIVFNPNEKLVVSTAEVSEDLIERSGKKAQYEKAKRILKDYMKYDAGIFVFSDPAGSFRFSLVYGQAEGTRKSWSNFRRFTYFVSRDQTNNTFLGRVGGCDFSGLDIIKDAFSVEKVNKEFYKEIAKYYYRLTGKNGYKRELVLPSVAEDDGKKYEEYAVRLIGRIIFCWFLKHKKSANGIPLITKEALSLSAVQNYPNYYHSILESLFFEVMNKPVKYRKPFTIPQSDLIPFLNGGLFEPHVNDYYQNTPNYALKIPDRWFEDFFSVLEQYNFTIDENSIVDADVSVDPEMLGRIFENLLAEVVPETGETARKATGSYYTPRVIVDYMVEQSLKQYLLTRTTLPEDKLNQLLSYEDNSVDLTDVERNTVVKALKEIKVIDPACGSGAFPMGILHRMLLALEKVDPKLELWRRLYLSTYHPVMRRIIEDKLRKGNEQYIRKLTVIQDSIYGVDIQPIAVEIAKLRCFLSLVVDEIVLDNEENRGIEPLPNLEFKFIAANTLIGLPSVAEQSAFGITETVNRLKELRENYLRSFGDEKLQIEKEFRTTQQKLFKESVKWALTDAQVKQLTEWDPFSYKPCSWFDPAWMFGIDAGFDIAIANPPYIKEYVNRKAFDGLRNSPYYKGKMDIWYLFACQSIDHLKNNGILTFIAQNNWVTSYGASKMRNKVITDTRIVALLDFGDYKIFETSGIQTMVMNFQKDKETDNYKFDYRRALGDSVSFEDILDLLNYRTIPNTEYLTPKIQRVKSTNTTLTFSHSGTEKVTEKIRSKANFRLNENEIAQGIVPNPDVVNKRNIERIPKDKITRFSIRIGDGVFVITKDMFRYLNEIERKYIKPLYEPFQMSKYYISPRYDKEIIYITKNNFENDCPNILNHLQKYMEIMAERRENLEGKLEYYHLHWPRNSTFFERGPKILSIRKCVEPTFIYSELETYVMMAINVIKTNRLDLKYLSALLNSKLEAFWLYHMGKMQGNNYQIDKEPLLAIPIYKPSIQEQQSVISLVDQILAITKSEDYQNSPAKQAKVKELERRIDQMVYELYGLTPEEIEVVEGTFKK